MAIDLNCDMGETTGNDEAIIPFINSANIACGYHAGDATTMWQTTELAVNYGVNVGAHPSFPDKKNFGRTEMQMSLDEVYEIVIQQLILLNDVTATFGVKLHHVKPHGALYNMSARDPALAETIAQAVKDFDDQLTLFGLSGSHSIEAAKKIGLKTANEVFADRAYLDDGSLVPRSQPGALIENAALALQQVVQMVNEGMVTTLSGKKVSILADTVCIHGDGKNAVAFAKSLREKLDQLDSKEPL